MTGTDDRSPGSIGDWARSWGMSPDEANRIEAIAAAIVADAHVADQRSSSLHEPYGQRHRRGAHRDHDA